MTGFKNFLLRGNLIELAVTFIMGGAFATVVTATVDLIMDLVGKAETALVALKVVVLLVLVAFGLAAIAPDDLRPLYPPGGGLLQATALLFTAFVLLILACARPAAIVTLATRGGTIIMAIDVSGSMRAADVLPNRISAAQVAAKAFVDKRDKPIRIGIVGFSGSAFLVQAPTTDTAELDKAIENLQPQFTTAVGSAVVTSGAGRVWITSGPSPST